MALASPRAAIVGLALWLSGCDGAPAPSAPVAVPAGRFLFQPQLNWADGDVSHQGTGFFVTGENGAIIAVTSAHFVNFDGPQLLRLDAIDLVSDSVLASFEMSVGVPGDAGRMGRAVDLRSDRLILASAAPVTGVAALALDPRDQPDEGERVWLPNKLYDGSGDGYVLIEGTIVEARLGYVGVQLDQLIALQSQSGSPIISQRTGLVIGTLSRGGESDEWTVLYLTPSGPIKRAAAAPERPLLRDVIGRP